MDNILKPETGTLRTIFLYVGQGESILMMIPDGDEHKYVLIDSNMVEDDEKSENIAELLKDIIGKDELIFINTHPHKDHLKGIDEIHEALGIGEIWHSGHISHKDNRKEYDKMKKIIDDIGEDKVFYLKGSNELNIIHSDIEDTSKKNKQIGDADFQVFGPAQYVIDDVEDETEDQRRNRIHEQCGVIKFTYKGKSILITGDSDKTAWKEHITEYYNDDLESDILSASHHGSRSFFKDGEDDKDIFEDHIEKISPEYLVISAPKDSKFDHPHDDAMKIYKKYTTKDNIYNLGDNEKSLIIDIDSSGKISIVKDDIKVNRSKTIKNKPKEIFNVSGSSKPYYARGK